MEYRIKFDGYYVRNQDNEYLVQCKEEESVFSEAHANAIVEKCPTRAKAYKIITKEYEANKYE